MVPFVGWIASSDRRSSGTPPASGEEMGMAEKLVAPRRGLDQAGPCGLRPNECREPAQGLSAIAIGIVDGIHGQFDAIDGLLRELKGEAGAAVRCKPADGAQCVLHTCRPVRRLPP